MPSTVNSRRPFCLTPKSYLAVDLQHSEKLKRGYTQKLWTAVLCTKGKKRIAFRFM